MAMRSHFDAQTGEVCQCPATVDASVNAPYRGPEILEKRAMLEELGFLKE